MQKHDDLCRMAIEVLEKDHELSKLDLGDDAHLEKNGMVFDTEAYTVAGLGHLCIMRMSAMLGLMKMETVVLAATEKDIPLLNIDWVSAAALETQIIEYYDTQLEPCSDSLLNMLRVVKSHAAGIPDKDSTPHWYDALIMPVSVGKRGVGCTRRFNDLSREAFTSVVSQAGVLPPCDSAAKAEKVRAFAEGLVTHGGPAVDQVTKLFGAETARRLVVNHMYGMMG